MSSDENEIVAPHVISMLWTKTDTRTIVEPQSTTLRLLHWNFQTFTTPQPLNSFVIHTPAFFAKHHRDSTIAITAIARRQIGHSFHQPGFIIRDIQSPTLRRSRLTENATRSTFGNAITSQSLTHVLDRPTTLRRTQKFPEAASRRMDLSSSASATSFFKRAFSRSSSFKRLA